MAADGGGTAGSAATLLIPEGIRFEVFEFGFRFVFGDAALPLQAKVRRILSASRSPPAQFNVDSIIFDSITWMGDPRRFDDF